jgi:hypothetical protein
MAPKNGASARKQENGPVARDANRGRFLLGILEEKISAQG